MSHVMVDAERAMGAAKRKVAEIEAEREKIISDRFPAEVAEREWWRWAFPFLGLPPLRREGFIPTDGSYGRSCYHRWEEYDRCSEVVLLARHATDGYVYLGPEHLKAMGELS